MPIQKELGKNICLRSGGANLYSSHITAVLFTGGVIVAIRRHSGGISQQELGVAVGGSF